MHTSTLRRLSCFALSLPLLALSGCEHRDQAWSGGNGGEGEESNTGAQAGLEAGTITKIRGSRGLESPELPAGAFLGEGAAVHAGQWVELPRGTRVEIELATGQLLRLDEDSRVRLPGGESGGGPSGESGLLTVERGRMVILADAGLSAGEREPLEIAVGEDRLVVERGEVELHHAGETRHYGVVQGHAILHTDGREIPLGAGASISTPAAPSTRPEAPVDPEILAAAFSPELSLDPLHESAWAQAFQDSEAIADDLPLGVGSLVARRAGSQVERQSLRITQQRVRVSISGRVARTEIEQTFHNDSGQTLEGIYQFPMPSDASVSDLQLLVGETWVRGEMLEKRRARQIFRQIVDATVPRDPALLQWEQGGVFKLNIFPIPGKGERRIKIAYTQVLPTVGETLRYRYPMGGSGATATEIGDFEFSVEVDGRALDEASLRGVVTPMAELSRARSGDNLALTMRERDYRPTHELGVDIPVAQDARRVSAATHRDRDGQGYFMLTLKPELTLRADPRPVHYSFVLDRSHGTSPELWVAAEGMTKAMLATLEPDDRFTVLACDTACDELEGGLQGAQGTETLSALDAFLGDQVLAGASDIGNMLEHAAGSFATEGNADVERVIVYLGDGVPTSGALTPDELGTIAERSLGEARIQAVAMGARSDLLVLDNLVRRSGGDLTRIDARDDLGQVARELRLRAQVPVAHDLTLSLPPGLTDVYPRSVPALRPGDTLTIVGKLASGDSGALRGEVRLSGAGPSGVVDEHFQVTLEAGPGRAGEAGVHAHLPRTWAQYEITHLTQHGGAEAREQIVALSREYNVLSRWTALLVLENDRMFREFNVARRAGKKSGWDGKLDTAAGLDAGAETKSEVTASTQTSKDAGEAGEDLELVSEEELAKNNERAPKGTGETVGGFDALEPDPTDFGPDADASSEDQSADLDEAMDALLDGDGGGGFAPPPPSKKKSKAASRPASSGADQYWPDQSGPWNGPSQRPRWAPPKVALRDAGGPSSADRQAIAELQRQRDADPSSRKRHRALVTRATRAGDPNRLVFAAAWAAADPDHAPALLAHGDALAASGDPLALRAYASAVEVQPFSKRQHRRMAEALAQAGDFERACSHRRALVSIDPSDGRHAADLVTCLVQAGHIERARASLDTARGRVSSSAGKRALGRAASAIDDRGAALAGKRAPLYSGAELRAELRWHAAENLDVALIDHRARRLSVLRPQGVRVREQQEGAERVEIVTLRELRGTVFIEVTRPDSRREDPIPATLTVRTPTGRRTWELELTPGTQRVALTRWVSRGNKGAW